MGRNKGFGKKHSSFEEKQKVLAAYKGGKSVKELTEIFNLHHSTIYGWIKKNQSEKSCKRKTEPGSGRFHKLDEKEVKKLINMIKKPATKFGFETPLWNTKKVQILCEEEFDVNLSRMSIWRYLRNVGHSCKKVQKLYKEANKTAQQEWTTNTVRKIKRTVKKHRAILYFEDESNISLSSFSMCRNFMVSEGRENYTASYWKKRKRRCHFSYK